MVIVTILLVSVLFILTWIIFVKNETKRVLLNKLPGNRSYPLVGSIFPLIFMTKPERFAHIRGLTKIYGPLYRSWVGPFPVVNLTDPHYIELILNNTTHLGKGFVYTFVLPWLGEGLLTSTGEKWHRRRKLITPTFHFNILETFMDSFVEKSKLLVELLRKEANGKTTFNIFPYITNCTLDIIAETAMGIQVAAMSEKDNRYVEAVLGLCGEVSNRLAKPWLGYDPIYYNSSHGKRYLEYLSVLHNTTRKIIHERSKLRQQQTSEEENAIEDDYGRKKRRAFLDLLLDVSKDGKVLTMEEMREEVDTFMFAGHDTTTSSISWTLFMLGLHHDIQEKVYQEIIQVCHVDTPLQFTDLSELKYLERVLKESLRLYPSVPTIARMTSEDMKIDQYLIPKGVTIALHIYDVHRNPKYYPNPEKFDPDRFLPENLKDRHPYAYIPFSAGPRNCIGQKFALAEEKVVLSYILRNFKVTSTQTIDNVNPVQDIVLRPSEGLFVILEERSK
ncbi:Cytochrome P450 [Popillia japonica]|uniref:Cytochrome P450 n=1 Tax=Popillia japonica TaxID=7064 RepID=A0AAW1LQP5_POPJA